MIFDVGPDTAQMLAEKLKNAGTIVWNGPVGVFEFDAFSHGTEVMANAIADSEAFSIAGGGDTLAAIDQYGIADKMSYISTGGGAFLEFLEVKLPAVDILEQRAKTHNRNNKLRSYIMALVSLRQLLDHAARTATVFQRLTSTTWNKCARLCRRRKK